MINIDEELLVEVGLELLPADAREEFLRHIRAALELRVGQALASVISATDLAEFEAILTQQDEQAARAWLKRACPDYAEATNAAFEDLKIEIANIAPQILASAQNGTNRAIVVAGSDDGGSAHSAR